MSKPSLHTCLSPPLLDLYDVSNHIVVIIDVLRATSTIATALFNGAKCVIPVDSVAECIALGKKIDCITAGERDGKIAEGLKYGNSPFEYPREFIEGKTLVLTTTNGTKLMQMALERGADHIVTGSFPNLSAVWKGRVNIEDLLFAGAVIQRIKQSYSINCDSSQIAATLYEDAHGDLFEFIKQKNASHYHRLSDYGLQEDIRYCLTADMAGVLPFFEDRKLVVHTSTR
jgi:2-phosphosulfolactate phosphatase